MTIPNLRQLLKQATADPYFEVPKKALCASPELRALRLPALRDHLAKNKDAIPPLWALIDNPDLAALRNTRIYEQGLRQERRATPMPVTIA